MEGSKMMKDGRAYGMKTFENSGEETREDVRIMAYSKLLMDELGVDQKKALDLIKQNGLKWAISLFQAQDPDEMEDKFETMKTHMKSKGGMMKEIEDEE